MYSSVKTWLILLLVAVLLNPAAAVIDDRTVILMVTKDKAEAKALKAKLLNTREEMGFSKKDIPIVFMTFDGSETERAYCKGLGISAKDSPIVCVTEWGQQAHSGPKRILEHSLIRSASRRQVDGLFVNYFKAVHHSEEAAKGIVHEEGHPDEYGPGALIIESHRFEASGKPFYITDSAIRVRNDDDHPLRDIVVSFYSKLHNEDEWTLLEKQVVEKLPKGFHASRDFVGNTQHLKLIDKDGNAIKCLYRIEVAQGGQVLFKEGEFIPSELPVDVR